MLFHNLCYFMCISSTCFLINAMENCYKSIKNGKITDCCENHYLVNNTCKVCFSVCFGCDCFQLCQVWRNKSGCNEGCTCPDCYDMDNCSKSTDYKTDESIQVSTLLFKTGSSKENFESTEPSNIPVSITFSNGGIVIIIFGTLISVSLLGKVAWEMFKNRRQLSQCLCKNSVDPECHQDTVDTNF